MDASLLEDFNEWAEGHRGPGGQPRGCRSWASGASSRAGVLGSCGPRVPMSVMEP